MKTWITIIFGIGFLASTGVKAQESEANPTEAGKITVATNNSVQNLGVVEFTEGIPKYFSLGDKRSCTAVANYATDGIEVDFQFQVTNSDGSVNPLGASKLIAPIPDQFCIVTSGDVSIGLIPVVTTNTLACPTVHNLGAVVFTEGKPRNFNFGHAISCTATATRVPIGIQVDFLIQMTNSDGTAYSLGSPRLIATIPNQYCDITSGGVTIELIPKLKIPPKKWWQF
jgi:hypothetical protein